MPIGALAALFPTAVSASAGSTSTSAAFTSALGVACRFVFTTGLMHHLTRDARCRAVRVLSLCCGATLDILAVYSCYLYYTHAPPFLRLLEDASNAGGGGAIENAEEAEEMVAEAAANLPLPLRLLWRLAGWRNGNGGSAAQRAQLARAGRLARTIRKALNKRRLARRSRFVCLPAPEPVPDCVICHEPMGAEGEPVLQLVECRHAFHPQCISRWFSVAASCPLCRATFTAP
eukprot:TRINITY_DN22289_c0_g1_i1.p1 TRINITY_DN22289_c0_g1~~TRINITY_DN22289_c0_g1_i1.p1  ORF type:complete len:250 (+),score=24.72 TRINITY_DN22289_c0_g1_i1:57-752(+)